MKFNQYFCNSKLILELLEVSWFFQKIIVNHFLRDPKFDLCLGFTLLKEARIGRNNMEVDKELSVGEASYKSC